MSQLNVPKSFPSSWVDVGDRNDRNASTFAFVIEISLFCTCLAKDIDTLILHIDEELHFLAMQVEFVLP